MLTIYHNPRCKKSRGGLQYLSDHNIEVRVVEYLKEPLTVDQLKTLLMKLNKKPQDIVRTQEELYKMELKGRNFTDDEWIKILTENPKLIQRPIVEDKHKAVIAQPPEKIDELIKK